MLANNNNNGSNNNNSHKWYTFQDKISTKFANNNNDINDKHNQYAFQGKVRAYWPIKLIITSITSLLFIENHHHCMLIKMIIIMMTITAMIIIMMTITAMIIIMMTITAMIIVEHLQKRISRIKHHKSCHHTMHNKIQITSMHTHKQNKGIDFTCLTHNNLSTSAIQLFKKKYINITFDIKLESSNQWENTTLTVRRGNQKRMKTHHIHACRTFHPFSLT